MKTWFNSHQHTTYSFLDGHADPRRLLERAKQLGMGAIAQTDHGNIHGWLDFYQAAKDVGIKPVLGIESYQARKTRHDRDEEERAGKAIDELEQRGPYHLTVLARDRTGYKNLIKLSSESFLDGFYVKPRIDHETLARYSEGLTVLSGCLNGEICQALLRDDYQFALQTAKNFQDIVGRDYFYIEIMDHGLPEQKFVTEKLIQIAKHLNAPIVPTADCHYVRKEDAHAHDVMLCVATHSKIHDENRFKFYNDEFYLKSYEEMALVFPDEWLKNTLTVADQVNIELSFGDIYFPSYPKIPEGQNEDSFLRELVAAGLERRYGTPLPQAVKDRANHEFAVVKEMGFQSYFLVVSDLIAWAKNNQVLTGWGRGSAAGSILSYALGITDLDPLQFGLLFERFLVEGRKSMPDIDLDFDDRYRDKVIDYARNLYGDDRVAHICTFSSVKAKQAIRDAAMALGYEYSEGDRVAKLVPPPVLGVSKTIDECMSVEPFLKAYSSDSTVKHIVDTAKQLEGLLRQPGIHAAGVVIAQSPITDFIPVMQRPSKDGGRGPVVTQWNDDYVELCGLLKIDFLGIRNLAVVIECVNNVFKTQGIEIDVKSIPVNNKETYESLCSGNTVGVFQLESAGMRDMAIDVQPSSIEDIMTIITLFRPGPLGSGMDRTYIARRRGKEKVSYDHPILEELLQETFGVMLYQEDVLNVSKKLAGFSPGEADDLRKAMGKKQLDKIGLFRQRFVEGCKSVSGIDSAVANKIYSDIEYFGGYGFNRAHAASYAMLSYVTAYLKTNYPAEYMAALLSSVTDSDRMRLYLNECRRMGLAVLPPSIMNSQEEFKVLDDSTILFGLRSINGIGETVAPKLTTNNHYLSIYDFMRKSDLATFNRGILEHLLYSGAFDELIPEQPVIHLDREDRRYILDQEHQRLSSYIIEHPIWSIRYILDEHVENSILDISSFDDGALVKIGGLLTKLSPITTKKGDRMFRFEIEDLTGAIEVIMFPKVAKAYGDMLETGEMYVLSGRIQYEGGREDNALSIRVFVSELERLKVPDLEIAEPIKFTLNSSLESSVLDAIQSIIDNNPGQSFVYLDIIQDKHCLSFQFKKPTSTAARDQIETILRISQGVDNAIS